MKKVIKDWSEEMAYLRKDDVYIVGSLWVQQRYLFLLILERKNIKFKHTLSLTTTLQAIYFYTFLSLLTFLAAVKSIISLFLCEGNNSSISFEKL